MSITGIILTAKSFSETSYVTPSHCRPAVHQIIALNGLAEESGGQTGTKTLSFFAAGLR